MPGARSLRELADTSLELGDRGHVARLDAGERLGRRQVVVVGVDEARDDRRGPGVDLLGVRRQLPPHRLDIADRDDPIAVDPHGGRSRSCRIHRQDRRGSDEHRHVQRC